MAEQSGAWIVGIGMMTAVGDCAAQTAASVRAGISRYRESSIYNRRFQPMTMALLPEEALPPLNEELAKTPGLTSRQIRMLRLAEPALKEAVRPIPSIEQVPLFLAAPEARPERPHPVTDAFLDHLRIQVDVPFDRGRSAVFPTGRAGGLQALEAAIAFLDEEEEGYALVGGLDSYLDLYLLASLDQEDRVLADGIMDGFAPGEGAAFLLLASERALEAGEATPVGFVSSAALAEEPGHRYSDEPYKGEGLAEAIAVALEPADGEPIQTVLASLNGENYGAKEWGVAALRNSASLDPEHAFEHPADCFGDTGAAAGPLLLGLAAIGMNKGYLADPSLVWCSSEGELRGAARVTMKPGEEA